MSLLQKLGIVKKPLLVKKDDSKIDLENGKSVESLDNSGIIMGYELLGTPIPISYREMARHPRNEKLHKLTRLLDADFYHKTFYVKTIQQAATELDKQPVNNLIEKVVSSSVNIKHIQDNVFIFLADFANYEQAVQFLQKRPDHFKCLSAIGKQPIAYSQLSGIDFSGSYVGCCSGLAHVAIFSQQVDFREYFKTPKDMHEFDGNYRIRGPARKIFEEHFRKPITEKAKEIQELKKVNIKGLHLSDIKTEYQLADAIVSIGTSPIGEFLMGASYLV